MARVGVIGTGYVGLVAGTCFADVGNDVICVDSDSAKIEGLRGGQIPIYEPGLAEMVRHNVKAGRLQFTTDIARAVAESLILFVAVGTPQGEDGSADLSCLLSVIETVGRLMDGYRIIVTKSTVPVGTHKNVTCLLARVTSHPFDYVSNPEFMKEGAAIEDFTRPDRVVIGTRNPAVVEILKQLYMPFMRKRERILVMDPASAEMTKYASNCAAGVADRLHERSGSSVREKWCGRGGRPGGRGIGLADRDMHSCFRGRGSAGRASRRTSRALIHMGQAAGSPVTICEAAYAANHRHRRAFAARVIDYFAGERGPLTLAVWGLAFKGRTDDVRESPAIIGVRAFLERGLAVRAPRPGGDPERPHGTGQRPDHLP